MYEITSLGKTYRLMLEGTHVPLGIQTLYKILTGFLGFVIHRGTIMVGNPCALSRRETEEVFDRIPIKYRRIRLLRGHEWSVNTTLYRLAFVICDIHQRCNGLHLGLGCFIHTEREEILPVRAGDEHLVPHEWLKQAIGCLLMDIWDADTFVFLAVILVIIHIQQFVQVVIGSNHDTTEQHPQSMFDGLTTGIEPFRLGHGKLCLISDERPLHTFCILGKERNIGIVHHLLDRRLEASCTARSGITAEDTMGVHFRQDAPRESHDHSGKTILLIGIEVRRDATVLNDHGGISTQTRIRVLIILGYHCVLAPRHPLLGDDD